MTGQDGSPGEFDLVPLPIPVVVSGWDSLSPWVEKVRRKTKSPWRVEDVYVELKEGRAVAYLAMVDGVPSGLLVLVDHTDDITRKRKLAMWIAYSEHPTVVDRALDRVEQIARSGGFSAVTGMSPRKGWLRKLAPKGYNLVAYCFEKELA